MTYTHQFDQSVVERYKNASTVRAVLCRMGSLSDIYPGFPSTKPHDMKITDYRILEIEKCSDWGASYTDAPRYITHNSQRACERMESHCCNWHRNVKGRRSLDRFAKQLIKNLRDRIDPALYGMEKELDPKKSARAAYEAIEAKAIQAIESLIDPVIAAALPKSKLRAHQVDGIGEVLKIFEQDLQSWTQELVDCLTED